MPKKSSKKAKSQGVTLQIVREHVQHTHGTMLQKFSEIDRRFDGVDKRFDGVDKRLDRLEGDMSEVKHELRFIKAGIENIDQRLEDVEINRLPKLEAKVLQ